MSSVQISSVQKSYGDFSVLHGISAPIEDGEFVVLVGPSGCGKSTLLRVIAGLEDVTDGEIAIDGERVNEREPKDRDIAMVFQNYALYPQMTVRKNLRFALELQRKPEAEICEKVDNAAEILGLQPLMNRKPAQLSGGQRQRVAMGRAIVRDPKVFLFDEPLSNLDAKLRVQMRGEIKGLHRRLGATIIYVTHDQIEAMTMADKIIVMNAGKIEQVGTPLALYDQPANTFVAEFLGSPGMNLIPGEISEDNNTSITFTDGTIAKVSSMPISTKGKNVQFGIRPENITIVKKGGLMAKVLEIDPTGADTHLTLSIAGQEVFCIVNERVNVLPNDEIQIDISSDRAHCFSTEDGTRCC